MKKTSLLISSVVLASLSLTSCGEMKANSEESKTMIKEVVNKYSNGEVTLPETKSVTVTADSLTSLTYNSNNYSISSNGEFGLSEERLYFSAGVNATIDQDTYGAKVKAEVSDKTYLGIEINGIPEEYAPMITLMGLKTTIKGCEDISLSSILEEYKIDFDDITSIPGFEIDEETEKAIDDFLAKSEDEVKYYAFIEGGDIIIKAEMGKTGLEKAIKDQLEDGNETETFTVTVDAEAKVAFQVKFDAKSYLISSITSEQSISALTMSDGTNTVSVSNISSRGSVNFAFGGVVNTITNKDKYTDSISEEIGKWVELISSLGQIGTVE